jgi:hypothetical protein
METGWGVMGARQRRPISRIEMGFPHDMLAKEMPRSLSYGGMWDRIDAQ